MFNRSKIMKRAWELFRKTYRYPLVPFASVGWPCFGWALKQAWKEARDAAAIKAIPETEKAQRIDALNNQIAGLAYKPFGHRISQERHALEAQISKLAA